MEKDMGQEKRQLPRIDHIFKIKYIPNTNRVVDSTAKDLSFGGVAFETRDSLAVGTTLDVKIYLEEIPGEIPAKANVIRSWNDSGKYFVAVKFTELDENDQIVIEEYLNYFEEGIITG